MAGGSSSTQPTQTTTTQISPQAQALFGLAYPSIASYAAAPPTSRYPGSTVAGFTPTQEAAQAAGVSAAGSQADIANRADALAAAIPGMISSGGSLAFNPTNIPISSDVFGEANAPNPALEGAIAAAQRPTWEALTQQALPAVRQSAIAQGPFGGSREQLAESRAVELANRQAADTAAQMAQSAYATNVAAANQRYGTNINALLQEGQQGLTARGQDLSTLFQTLGLTPQLQAAYTAPAATLGAVGDVQQQMNQAQLNDAINAYYYQQMAPYLKATDILGLIPSIPGASTTSTGNVPQPNPTTQALGGALSGAAIGSTFGPIGTGVGAIGGATLPFLFR